MRTMLVTAAMVALIVGQTARAQEAGPLVSHMSLHPDTAHALVMATVKACREGGIQVAAAVVDRGGNVQAVLRDQFAGEFTVPLAVNKARTAASFNADTGLVAEATKEGGSAAGVRGMPEVVAVGGGYPIVAKGSTVGALAVAGGPDTQILIDCAKKALDDITADLDM